MGERTLPERSRCAKRPCPFSATRSMVTTNQIRAYCSLEMEFLSQLGIAGLTEECKASPMTVKEEK